MERYIWEEQNVKAGESVVDITPPLGIELAGFHQTVGNERVITGIRCHFDE